MRRNILNSAFRIPHCEFMDKLKMQSLNKVEANIAAIGKLFPNCLTERLGENGEILAAIDFDMLKQELSSVVVEGTEERYQFTWPDKRKAVLAANAPISATLRPCREESVDFDATENLYIEGDNLDVLKLLQETYLGKIKMIYIDPPYNTGNDFVYNDDFAEDAEEYLANSGQYDEQGNRLVTNTESNGRFHTDWLNMLYPRLKISRDLLTEDGIVFISIDDNEVENLRRICNEIFGAENFQAQIVWRRKRGKDNSTTGFSKLHEYIIAYSKGPDFHPNRLPMEQERINVYANPDNDPKGAYVLQPAWASGMKKGPKYAVALGDIVFQERMWLYSKETLLANWKDGRLAIKGTHKDGLPNVYLKVYLSESKGIIPDTIWDDAGNTGDAVTEIKALFDGQIPFGTPKPLKFMDRLIRTGANEDSIVLDFFSGSASTAHAVMQLNAEDGGHRRFIMVQLPEETDAKSDAYKEGYKNICEIGKERIRRAGRKIKEDSPLTTQDLDIGFRVLKLDSSNMKDVYYNPADVTRDMFDLLADNIKEDRTAEDLLFQVMLDRGIPLSGRIEETVIAGKNVFSVEDNFLIACFDNDLTDDVIKAIAEKKPYYFVMRDSSMADDSVATNFDQIFATYSPDTDRKVI